MGFSVFRKPAVVVSLSALLAAPLAIADQHNAIKDPGFEMQTAAEDGGWRPFQISMYSKNHARSGEWSMYNGGYSRKITTPPYRIGNDSGAFQEFEATAGSTWRMTGYALTPKKLTGSPTFGLIQISFFDDKGKDLGTVETEGAAAKAKLSEEVNAMSAYDEWIMLDTGVATAPEGTALIRAFTLFVDHSGSNDSQGVYFDDMVLCETDDNGDCEGD